MWDELNNKFFRIRAKSYRTEWDKESLWDKIEAELPPEEKNRNAGWWWYLTGCILLFAIIIVAFTGDASVKEHLSDTTLLNKSTLAGKLINEEKEVAEVEKDIVAEQQLAVAQNPMEEVLLNPAEQISETLYEVQENSAVNYTEKGVYEVKSDEIAEELIINASDLPTSSMEAAAETVPFVKKPAAQDIQRITTVSLLSKNDLLLLDNKEIEQQLSPITTPLKGLNWSLELWGGFGFAQRDLSATVLEERDYVAQRRKTEQPLEVISQGLRVNLSKKNSPWTLQTGLTRRTLTEEFNFTEENQELVPVALDSAYYVTTFAGTLFFGDTIDGTETTLRTVRNFNKHNFYDIPVLIGYTKNFGRLSTSLNAGASFNIAYDFIGKIASRDGKILDEMPTDQFNTAMSVSYLAEFQAAYALPAGYDITLSGQYNLRPQSVTNINSTHLTQQYNFMQLRLGIRKHF